MGGARRTARDLDIVRELSAGGATLSAISRATGISRATARQWLTIEPGYLATRPSGCAARDARETPRWPAKQYAYLLGLYLGDGCISLTRRNVFALRISLDDHYPGIIGECSAAMEAVLPGHKPNLVQAPGCTVVVTYSKHWPCMIPQHGPGPKHLRAISLERWQVEIVENHAGSFLRGLIHSDGCRFINRVRTRGKDYAYPKYEFKNLSQDIHGLFQWACGLLGVETRHPNAVSTTVAKRRSVAVLDRHIGSKV